jgi:hypothetical protein
MAPARARQQQEPKARTRVAQQAPRRTTDSAALRAGAARLPTRRALTLWKGPICWTPAYDLKFSSVMCVMMRRVRGAPALAALSDGAI